MSKKKESDLRKQFEAVLGPELELDDFRDELEVVAHIATRTLQNGGRTSRRVDVVLGESGMVGNSRNDCITMPILDVSGKGKTGGDGTVELMLSNYLCSDELPDAFTSPAIVVATPRAQSPVFVTARASLTSNQRDVRIRVAAWDASGSPAPNLYFNWMCRVPTTVIID